MNSVPYFTDAGNKGVEDIVNALKEVSPAQAFLINNAMTMLSLEDFRKIAIAQNQSEMLLKIETALEILQELATAIAKADKMQKEKQS